MARGKGRSMLAAERRATIARLAKQHGSVRVADLRRQFDVTEETIRRDLEELEKSGYLKRTYGGAVSINGTGFELPYTRQWKPQRRKEHHRQTYSYSGARRRDYYFRCQHHRSLVG